jgi:hypothetical protein
LVFKDYTHGTNFNLSCGSYFGTMLELTKEQLEDTIYTDYKQALSLLEIEKPNLIWI